MPLKELSQIKEQMKVHQHYLRILRSFIEEEILKPILRILVNTEKQARNIASDTSQVATETTTLINMLVQFKKPRYSKWLKKIKAIEDFIESDTSKEESAEQDIQLAHEYQKKIEHYHSIVFLSKLLSELRGISQFDNTISKEQRTDSYIFFLSIHPDLKRLPIRTTDDFEFIGREKIESLLRNIPEIVEENIIFGDPDTANEYEQIINSHIRSNLLRSENRNNPPPKEEPLKKFKEKVKKTPKKTQLEAARNFQSIEEEIQTSFALFHLYIPDFDPFSGIEFFINGGLCSNESREIIVDNPLRQPAVMTLLINLEASLKKWIRHQKSESIRYPKLEDRTLSNLIVLLISPETLQGIINYIDQCIALGLHPHENARTVREREVVKLIFDFLFKSKQFEVWCQNVLATMKNIHRLSDQENSSDVKNTQEIETNILQEKLKLLHLVIEFAKLYQMEVSQLKERDLRPIGIFVRDAWYSNTSKTSKKSAECTPKELERSLKVKPTTPVERLGLFDGFYSNMQTINNFSEKMTRFEQEKNEKTEEEKTALLGKMLQSLAESNRNPPNLAVNLDRAGRKKPGTVLLSTHTPEEGAALLEKQKKKEGDNKAALQAKKKKQEEKLQAVALRQEQSLKDKKKQLIDLFEKYNIKTVDSEPTPDSHLTEQSTAIDYACVETTLLDNDTLVKMVIDDLAREFPQYKDFIKSDAIPVDDIRISLLTNLKPLLKKMMIDVQAIRIENKTAHLGVNLSSINIDRLEKELRTLYFEILKQLPIYKELELSKVLDIFPSKINEARQPYAALKTEQENSLLFVLGNPLIEAARRRQNASNCDPKVRTLALRICEDADTILDYTCLPELLSPDKLEDEIHSFIALKAAKENPHLSLPANSSDNKTESVDNHLHTLKSRCEYLYGKLMTERVNISKTLERLKKALDAFAKARDDDNTKSNEDATLPKLTNPETLKPASKTTTPALLKSSASAPRSAPAASSPSARSVPEARKIVIIPGKPLDRAQLFPAKPPTRSAVSNPLHHKLPLASASNQSTSLFDSILKEAISLLSRDIKSQWKSINPHPIIDDINRLSLRHDLYQIFYKLHFVINNTYEDICHTSPNNPLLPTLANFCNTLRLYRNRLIHQPNYVDLKLEEEAKKFILNSKLIEYCTELQVYAKNLSTQTSHATTDNIIITLENILMGLSECFQLLESYQYLQKNEARIISFDECHEQLAFAIKLLAFNDEILEKHQPPLQFKLRCRKATAMLAVIISKYGYSAPTQLSADDFSKLNATPLYQSLIAAKFAQGNAQFNLLEFCNDFRDRKFTNLEKSSGENRKQLNFSVSNNEYVDYVPDLEHLKNQAKKICFQLSIKNLSDTLTVDPPQQTPLIPRENPVPSSHVVIASKLKYNARAPVFVPSTTSAKPIAQPPTASTSTLTLESTSPNQSMRIIQQPLPNQPNTTVHLLEETVSQPLEQDIDIALKFYKPN